MEQAEPRIVGMERDIEREEDPDRGAHVRNHMAALLEAIQRNRVTLCPVAEKHGVGRGVAQAAAGDDAAADAVEAGVIVEPTFLSGVEQADKICDNCFFFLSRCTKSVFIIIWAKIHIK